MLKSRSNYQFLILFAAFLSLVFIGSCGQKKSKKTNHGSSHGKVEAAFHSSAGENNLPARYMMAIAQLESGFSPQTASANYINPANPELSLTKGTIMTQTAFGMSLEELFNRGQNPDFDPENPEYSTFEAQIAAYGKWLNEKMAEASLSANPSNAEQNFQWIWQLAQFHREGLTQRRNVRVLFALELINVLNEGFIWQDPNNAGEIIKFAKASPPIEIEDFPINDQGWFSLDMDRAEIDRANYFPLVTVPSTEYENVPKRIEVIHCPLSLSACLELQNQPKGEDVRLGAHYIIPPDDNLVDRPLQVAKHHHPVLLTNSLGDHIHMQDAVVVMLTGQSGRLVSGARQPANPTWFSDNQLRSMGKVINDVCTLLSQDSESFNRSECMGTTGDNGVRFRKRVGEEYRWSEIPDFDSTIFEAYIYNPGGLQGEAAFEFPQNVKEFKTNQSIPLTVLFQHTATSVEIERLARCPNGKVVWEPIEYNEVRGNSKLTIYKKFYDAGPNGNGDQFFRARVYDLSDELMGWSIDRIFLTGFEDAAQRFASAKYCAN